MSIVERAADKLRQDVPETAYSRAAVETADAAEPPDESTVERAADKLRQSEPDTGHHFHDGATSPQHEAAERKHTDSEQASLQPDVTVDFRKLRRAGMAPPAAAREMVEKEYQRIKRPLLANAATPGPPGLADANRFMVASAIPGEGKTFTSFNLALSLAKEKDFSVVLVDGDTVKASVSRALGLKNKQGLTDVLADTSVSFHDVVLKTDIPRLSFMPAGQYGEATELLASQRMTWLTNEMSRDPNRIIVFDSPPLLATAESQALATTMGQILVVVKAGSTDQSAVTAALSLVEDADTSVSMILNQNTKAHGDSYAGYYGGYYDGYDANA